MGVALYRGLRGAGALRRVLTAPRLPLLAGALSALFALLELIARMTMTSTATVGGPVGAPTHTLDRTSTLEIGNVAISTAGALLVVLLALAATLPPALLPATAAALLVCTANALSIALFHTVTIAGVVAQVVVACRWGRTGSRAAAPVLGLVFLALVLSAADPVHSEVGALTVLLAAVVPASAMAGLASRARSETLAHSLANEAFASSLLEHTARGERARIARELHDVVAHHISMIAVQAETARLATPGMPDTGARRLLEIGDTARAALTEMRRLLGVMREDTRDTEAPRDSPSARPVHAERRPQPGLGQINDLLDEARSASGTGVRLVVSGSPATLDPGVELAAYRIIQEALTNARRHAPGTAVDVELHYGPDTLRLRVRDNGPGAPAEAIGGGHGLLGMRERAAAVGGVLRTGSAEVGGYLVEAQLPAKAEDLA